MTIKEYTGLNETELRALCREEGLDYELEFNQPYQEHCNEPLPFEEWLEQYDEELSIELAELDAKMERDFNLEEYQDRAYNKYLTPFIKKGLYYETC